MFLSFFCRSRHEANAELWEEHVQEDQHRPSDECPSPLCKSLIFLFHRLIGAQDSQQWIILQVEALIMFSTFIVHQWIVLPLNQVLKSKLQQLWFHCNKNISDVYYLGVVPSSLIDFSSKSMQIFGFLALMCTILAIGNYIWEVNEGSEFIAFLPRQDGTGAGTSAFLTLWSYVIILNTVVPISLYVR